MARQRPITAKGARARLASSQTPVGCSSSQLSRAVIGATVVSQAMIVPRITNPGDSSRRRLLFTSANLFGSLVAHPLPLVAQLLAPRRGAAGGRASAKSFAPCATKASNRPSRLRQGPSAELNGRAAA